MDSWCNKPAGWQKELGQAYKASKILPKVEKAGKFAGHVLNVALAAKDFEEEVQASASAPKTRQATNAVVETGINLGVGLAAGAIGGKIGFAVGHLIPIPVVGPLIGAALGAVIGAGIGILADAIINTDFDFLGGKSVMDWAKDLAFDGVSGVKQIFGLCPAEG